MSGRELIKASTSTSAVFSSSYENLACPIILRRHLFIDLTSRSNKPPHQGAFSKLNVHVTPTSARYLVNSGCFTISLRVLAAALNVLPLSDTNFWGRPLLAVKRFRHLMNVMVDMSKTRSRCTARVTQQVNKHIQALQLLLSVTPWAGHAQTVDLHSLFQYRKMVVPRSP